MEREKIKLEFPDIIEKGDIEPHLPEIGGTEIVLQRHGKYERSTDSPNVGSLTEEGVKEVYEIGQSFFKSLFEDASEEERKQIDVLIIASDTQYEGGGHRSMETAEEIAKSLREQLEEFGLGEEQILNTSGRFSGEGDVRPAPKLREPQMFNNSPEFVKFLEKKYGEKGLDFWIAFEEDTEKETRNTMGAEGPDQIADRVKFMVDVMARYSRMYHKKNSGRRLIIWAATHYDTISPYVKRDVFGLDKEAILRVDYGAGISIDLDQKNREATAKIGGKEYEVPIRGSAK